LPFGAGNKHCTGTVRRHRPPKLETKSLLLDWVGPSKKRRRGRDGAAELANGFSPSNYPGDGAFFARDKSLAEGFQESYENGLQRVDILSKDYRAMEGTTILDDTYYAAGRSVRVPPSGLQRFNQAIKSTSKYFQQGSR
jgi:hypothetical protein